MLGCQKTREMLHVQVFDFKPVINGLGGLGSAHIKMNCVGNG